MAPCPRCLAEMVPRQSFPACSLCGIDLAGSDDPCPACRTLGSSPLDGIAVLGPWSGPLREWLSMLKYGGDRRLAELLACRLHEIIADRWPEATLVPVPPRRYRLLMEGRDAVGMICGEIGKRGVDVEKPLKRIGSQMQKSLDRESRLSASALKYAMKRRIRLKAKEYILFDDVSTTGSTLRVCAGLLKANGAEAVHGLVVCKD